MDNPNFNLREALWIAIKFLLAALVFSASSSTLIVSFLHGRPIFVNGFRYCPVLWEENKVGTILHTSCGCATVLTLLVVLSCFGVVYSVPHMASVFALIRERGKRRKRPRS